MGALFTVDPEVSIEARGVVGRDDMGVEERDTWPARTSLASFISNGRHPVSEPDSGEDASRENVITLSEFPGHGAAIGAGRQKRGKGVGGGGIERGCIIIKLQLCM